MLSFFIVYNLQEKTSIFCIEFVRLEIARNFKMFPGVFPKLRKEKESNFP